LANSYANIVIDYVLLGIYYEDNFYRVCLYESTYGEQIFFTKFGFDFTTLK